MEETIPKEKKQEKKKVQNFEALTNRPVLVFLTLLLLGTLIYSNTFSSSFHLDDEIRIVWNPEIQRLNNMLDLSGSRYIGYLSFALNYHFGGLNVFGYHLVNLLIHITNAFLVYLLVLFLFRTPRMQSFSNTIGHPSWIAFTTAFLFIAHPIQTQAVTYIVQRFASLATLFYLLAVVLFLKWRLISPDERYRAVLYIGAAISTFLAMKTKEITFTLPFMLLVIEAVFFGFLTRKRWFALIPFLLMLVIIPLARSGDAGLARVTGDFSRLEYFFTQSRVIVTYLRLLIFPVNQNLLYDYPIFDSILAPQVFLSFLFLLTLFSFSVYFLFAPRFTSHPLRIAGFGLLWFFLALSIESSIIPFGRVIFEHRLYLPSVGFFLAASVVIIGASHRWKALEGLTVGGLILLLSMVAYQRNLVWQDELTLWTDVVEKSPNNVTGYFNLGRAYVENKELDKAMQQMKTAIKISYDSYLAHYNRGLSYQEKNQQEEANLSFRKARFLKPVVSEAHHNTGSVYLEMERLDEATQKFQEALFFNPNNVLTRTSLGHTYKKQGKLEKAVLEYKKVLNLDPDNFHIYKELGMINMKQGKLPEAIEHFRAAIQKGSNDPRVFYNLGLVLYRERNKSDAEKMFRKAIQLNPDYTKAYLNLAIMYRDQGESDLAIQAFQEVVRIAPGDYLSHFDLALLLDRKNLKKEADQHYQLFLQLVNVTEVSKEMIDHAKIRLKIKGEKAP